MTKDEALKLALEALETLMLERGSIYDKAITALKERLAQPEQEPIKEQPDFSCDSCGNIPDEEGWLQHGRGCYTQSEDGGGYEYIPHADQKNPEFEAQPAPVKWSDYEPDGMHHTTPPQRTKQEPAALPHEMTPEMLRQVQTQSELGAYAAANFSGAYDLFNEFWRVAIAAHGIKENT
jgi:hypothetical protein